MVGQTLCVVTSNPKTEHPCSSAPYRLAKRIKRDSGRLLKLPMAAYVSTTSASVVHFVVILHVSSG